MTDCNVVKLLTTMPEQDLESAIVRAARISFGRSTDTPERDASLIRYLYRNKHTSPFEMVKFTFYIKCPIFVARQILRHRTADVSRFTNHNELSERYLDVYHLSYYHPSEYEDGIRTQASVNKQSSVLDNISPELKNKVIEVEKKLDSIFDDYEQMIKLGMARECARFCLPLSTYTEFYFCIDLHNLINFLRLRMDSHTQLETRKVANQMFELIKDKVPITMSCFIEEREMVSLTKSEIAALIRNDKELAFDSVSRRNFYLQLYDLE